MGLKLGLKHPLSEKAGKGKALHGLWLQSGQPYPYDACTGVSRGASAVASGEVVCSLFFYRAGVGVGGVGLG